MGKIISILGIKLGEAGKTRNAPDSECVRAYVKAVKSGRKKALKILNKQHG